ncbi:MULTISPECIES: YokU family protein [unclassified Bacillus (in: firmicutes)]|uniref:YokU family protein n=1 Tax=unclassified Bacillus (in: firmicutes) TaxID=185979 RepID=UPI000BF1C56C|nr:MULTISPECIES: YokU family protein [unclassified Bacillus (in: firmicutes)]PEJ59974.1 YokU family protein [Bacillus sp. AFS002410]PEL14478.1 YokU family protein [Bacillus sp. AFS017336]
MSNPLKCDWCGEENAIETKAVVHWELPDGSRAITITNVPSFHCNQCNFTYQKEEMVKEIENQLFLISTKLLPVAVSFDELMKQPRLLKRNYFDFSS